MKIVVVAVELPGTGMVVGNRKRKEVKKEEVYGVLEDRF